MNTAAARAREQHQQHEGWQPPWLVIAGVLAAVLAGMTIREFHQPWWLPAAVGGAAAGGWWVAAFAARRPRGITWYQVAWLLFTAGWASWYAWHGNSPAAWITLVVMAAAFGGGAPLAAPRETPTVPVALPGLGRDPLSAKWADMLDGVLRTKPGRGVDVKRIDHWPSKAGYTVHVVFPSGSQHTYKAVQQVVEGLAGALRLPKGCPIRVDEGDHQGSAVIKVSTVNDLGGNIPYPTSYAQRSIVNDFPIGLYRDKTTAVIDAYQSAGLIVGKRGGGKTVCLHNITASLAQCVDVVVWHVDLNGGSMAAPWLAPYAKGQIDRPAVDWVATTPEEAIRVAAAGLAIAKDRKARYQGLLVERNVDILPVSATLPAVIILVDEGGEVLGEDASPEAVRAAKALRELQRIGRAMCVNVIFSVMRGTSTYVPAGMKKLTDTKLVFRVDDDAELGHVFDWFKGVRATDLTAPGAAFLRRGTDPPEMLKGYSLLPQQIAEISLVTEQWHPTLDPAAARVCGTTYAERWTRPDTHRWLQLLAGVDPDVDPADARPADIEAAVDGVIPAAAAAEYMTRFAEQFKLRLDQQAAAPPPPVAEPISQPAAAGSTGEDWVARELAGIAGLPELTEARNTTDLAAAGSGADGGEAPLREGLAFVLKLLQDRGPMKTEDIVGAVFAAGLTTRRSTINNWLRELSDQRLATSPDYASWDAV